MSDVSKSLLIATMLFTSTSPSMLYSQEPSPVETGNVAEVHDSLSTEPTSILIMRPELDSLRTMAAAIVARNKHIRIEEPGAASGEPKPLEAELWLQPEVPNEIVEKIIGDVAKFGIVRIQLVRPFHDPDNTVVITAPADTPQRTIKDLQTNLALPDGFRLDVRIRDNEPSPSITPPQEIQSQITQLEVDLAVQKLQLGAEHPSIKSLEDRIAALRKTEESEPKPPVTVLPLRHAKATDVAEKFKQLDLGSVDAIVVDERTNSLMVRGTEQRIKDIEQLIEVLDAEVSPTGHGQGAEATTPAAGPTAGGASPLGRGGFGGRSAPAETPIAEYRRRLNNLEKPVLDLAEKVRAAGTSLGKEHPEYQKLLAELRALVQQTFATRQEIQRAELAEFTRRLERMKQAIDTREKIADKIVDRRVEELLNPDVDWGTSNSSSISPKSAHDNSQFDANSDLDAAPTPHSNEPFSFDAASEERRSVTRSVPEDRVQLHLSVDALVRDVAEFEDRTPLKLLMEFKDQPVLEITDNFKAAVSSLREQVKLDAPRVKLEECFDLVSQHGTSFVQAWSNVKSQSAKVVLDEIADDIKTLEVLIRSETLSERQMPSQETLSQPQNPEASAASARSPESAGTDDLILHVSVLEGAKLAADESILGFAIRNQVVTQPAANRLQELVSAKKMIVSIDQDMTTKQGQPVDATFGAAKDDVLSITPLEEDGAPVLDVSIVEAKKLFGGTENQNGIATETVRHEFRANPRCYGGREALFYFDMGGWIRLVRLSVNKKGSATGSDGSTEPRQIAAEQNSIRCKTIEAEVEIRLPGATSQFVYWHGFPVDASNRVIIVPDVIVPDVAAGIEIIRNGIDSLTIYVNRSPYPARVVATKSSPNLLMVELDAPIKFESAPFSNQDVRKGERIQACRYSKSSEYFAMEVGDVKAGVQSLQLDNDLSTWTGTVFLDRTLETFVGLGASKGEVILASEIAEWATTPVSSVNVHLLSDKSLQLTIANEPTRAPSTSATFDIPVNDTSKVQLSNIDGAEDLDVLLTIEPRCSVSEAINFYRQHRLKVELKDSDVGQLKSGMHITKALYISPGSDEIRATIYVAEKADVPPIEVGFGSSACVGIVRMSPAEINSL